MHVRQVLAGLAFCLMLSCPARAEALPAFPGAEGFGSLTTHARGKPVFRVTRLDDVDAQQNPGPARGPGESAGFRQALAAGGVVLDHVSVSFFRDGAVDAIGAKDITIQWSHMGDAIDSLTDEPYHGLPNLLRTRTDRVTIHHCSYTHGGAEPRGTIGGSKNFTIFVKDNIALSSGPDCPGHDNKAKGARDDHHILRGKDAAVAGCRPSFSLPETAILHKPTPGSFNVADQRIAGIPPLTYQPLPQAVNAVMARFGALPHDATDQRLQRELLTRTGAWKLTMPEDQNVAAGQAAPDDDGDGMPDAWEKKHGGDLDPHGHDLHEQYENLEVYLQGRIDELVDAAADVNAWERLTHH